MKVDGDQPCPCGTGKKYGECCQPFHLGAASAPTAEALMRSRYTAHVVENIPYLIQTVHPQTRSLHNPRRIQKWAASVSWVRLIIHDKKDGGARDETGIVEFEAWYQENGVMQSLHERSQFSKSEGKWMYVKGDYPTKAKPGRNDPCPCGSGKKHKKCCG